MNVEFLNFDRGTDIAAVTVLGIFALLGLIIGAFVKVRNVTKGKNESSILGALEAALLALLGGIIARLFIWLLLLPLTDLSSGAILVGHVFFLIPSVVDDFISLGSSRVMATPDGLLLLATIVGSFSGMMDGIWRIHDWKGFGWLSFPLDMTWGLAGLNYSLLLHLVNFTWGNHVTTTRNNAHQYKSGFAFKGSYAFTQGSVMSSLSGNSESKSFEHEMLHVWQNRAFGPFYTLSYIEWMLFWFLPGLFAGAFCNKTESEENVGVSNGIQRLCYYNNPWEVWTFKRHGLKRKSYGPELIWSSKAVILFMIPLYGSLIILLICYYFMLL